MAGRIAEALNAFVGGDPETARSALRELEPSTHSSELWPVFAMVEARVLHYLEGPRAALHRLQRTLADRASDPPMSPFMRRVLVSRAADLATCAGELSVARDLLTTELGDNRGALLLASLARLELTLGDVATAVGSLHESLRLPQDRTDNVDFKLLAATVWFSAGTARGLSELWTRSPQHWSSLRPVPSRRGFLSLHFDSWLWQLGTLGTPTSSRMSTPDTAAAEGAAGTPTARCEAASRERTQLWADQPSFRARDAHPTRFSTPGPTRVGHPTQR